MFDDLDPHTPEEWEALRRTGHRLVDHVIHSHQQLRTAPCWQPVPATALQQLKAAAPREGLGIEAAMARAQECIAPYATGNAHPRFWGFVQGAGNLPGIFGQWLATSMNANVWAGDQGPAQLELQVLEWFKSWFEFPASASGLLLEGASNANLLGLAIARQRATDGRVKREGLNNTPALRVYCSDATHNSLIKAAELLGLGADAVRRLPALADGRADVTAIERAVLADRAAGHVPCCVVANAGTVTVGAIDPLLELRALADRHGLWLHVDAAIGAFGWLSPAVRPRLEGMQLCDSLSFDLHKWPQIPYDAGCLLVRDGALHRATFATSADYLCALSGGITAAGSPAFDALGPQLSRADRALKIWLTFMALGVARVAAVVDRNLAHAQLMASEIGRSQLLELIAPVGLNIVCLRVRTPASLPPRAADALNERVLVALQESGLALLSQIRIGGRFGLRACFCNHRTRDEDVLLVVRELEKLATCELVELREGPT
jgi:aromatic-L-amino-acid/L-tryptophan decarboxylase